MRRDNGFSLATLAVVCAALALPSEASAQSWSSFSAAFPAFPCQDGWVACVVGDEKVDPSPAADAEGRLVAADLRVGWFDLEASPTFSPFTGLSTYAAPAPTVAAAAEPVPEPVDDGLAEAAPPEPSKEMIEAERRAEEAAAEAAVTRAAEADARRQAEDAAKAQKEAEATAKKQRAEEDAAKKAAAEAARKAAAAAVQAEGSDRERLQREAQAAAAKAAEKEKERQAADQAAEKQRQEATAAQAKAEEEERRRQEAEKARLAAEEQARKQGEEERKRQEEERARQEEAARQRAEQDAAAKAKADADARAKADAEAKARADADAAAAAKAAAAAAAAQEQLRLQQEAAAKAQAEAEAKARASADAEEKERARLEAERLAAEQTRLAEEQRKQQEEERKRQEEERKRQEEERKRQEEAAKAAAAAPVPAPVAAPAGGTSGDCADLAALEPVALLGRLSDEQTACLESNLQAAPKMTDKKKISLVQQANAWHEGDKGEWERLVKRHLEEIDQSDPDLCYRYAVHLSKAGVSRAQGVIRWSDVALENRSVWTGETYTSRVNSLYKVRTAAAQALWQAAENDHASTPSDASRKKADDYRAMTKVYAREWYEYAKSAGKDTQTPLQVCIQAAGTAGYCEN